MIPYVSALTSNKDVQNLNDAVQRVFNSLYPNPLLANPQLVKNITFIAGSDLWVDHKMGREIQGYIVVRSNAAAKIYTSPTSNTLATVRVCLRSDVNASVDILFF